MSFFIIVCLLVVFAYIWYTRHERFRRLVENAQEGICQLDTEGQIIYVNPYMSHLLGYFQAEMVGHSIFEFVAADTQKLHQHLAGLSKRDELCLQHQNRGIVWVMISSKPLKNWRGEVAGSVALLTNISRRKELESDLHRSHAHYQAIVNMQRDLICRYTPEGIITYVNPSYCEFHGKSKGELVGNSIFEVINPGLQEHIQRLLAEPHISYSNWEGPNAQGEMRWLRWCDQVILDKFGKAIEIQGVGQDITDQHHFEAYLENLNISLAQKSQQLEASNKELEAFSYSVSHDLRAPLRAIVGFTSLLNSEYPEQLPEQARHYLQRIHKNATHMGDLIDSLLMLSRLGRQSLQKSHFDLHELVSSIHQTMQENGQMPADMVFRQDQLPHCWGDSALLRQVFINLIHNAIKFSQKSNPRFIKISYTEKDEEFIFSVTDNGVGFDMQYADKLFGVFQTLHSRQVFEGTGIGLATVQQIINRHGGRVWAAGAENQGATFFFSLPKERTDDGYSAGGR